MAPKKHDRSTLKVPKGDLPEQPTWGAFLRKYRDDHCKQKGVPEPVHYVTGAQVAREQRKYNPILQTYTEPKLEKSRRKFEEKERNRRLNRARDTQLKYESEYDIVNLRIKREGIQKEPKNEERWVRVDTRVGYNILSNEPFAKHHWRKPENRPPQTPPPPPKQFAKYNRQRDFNIVSNKYREHHEAKTAQDAAIARQELLEKYWKTHDFNPLTVSKYDPELQREMEQKEEAEMETWGLDQVNRLPPSIKKSDGMAYNITNMLVKDPVALQRLEDSWTGNREKTEAKVALEEAVRARGVEEQIKAEAQALGRIHRDKFTETRERGFDIITLQRFNVGRGNKKFWEPQAPAKPTDWERVEMERQLRETNPRRVWDAHLDKEEPPEDPFDRPVGIGAVAQREAILNRTFSSGRGDQGGRDDTYGSHAESLQSTARPATVDPNTSRGRRSSGGMGVPVNLPPTPPRPNSSHSQSRPVSSHASSRPNSLRGPAPNPREKVRVTPLRLPTGGGGDGGGVGRAIPMTNSARVAPSPKPDTLMRPMSAASKPPDSGRVSVRTGGFQRLATPV